MEAIKIIIGHESFRPLTGKVWIVRPAHPGKPSSFARPKIRIAPSAPNQRKDIHLQYSSPVCGIHPGSDT
jgi:hypothetical protein